MMFPRFSAHGENTQCRRDKPIAALAACELASIVVALSTSMYFALRAASRLCKTAVLPFCPSTHSYGYGFQSRTARIKLADSPCLAGKCVATEHRAKNGRELSLLLR